MKWRGWQTMYAVWFPLKASHVLGIIESEHCDYCSLHVLCRGLTVCTLWAVF